MTPLELVALRFLIATPVLFGLVRLKRIRVRPGAIGSPMLASGLFTVHFIIQVYGLKTTTATNAGWIIAASPLAIAVLAALFLRERFGRRVAMGMLAATVGVILLVARGDWTRLSWSGSRGDWLVSISVVTWALYTIAIRDLCRKYHPLSVSLFVTVPATIALVAMMVSREEPARLIAMPAEPIIALLFLGILGTATAQWFWQEGVGRIGATSAGTFLYLEPLATMALAVPYLGESIGAWTVAGGGLILGGVWVAQRPDRSEALVTGIPRRET